MYTGTSLSHQTDTIGTLKLDMSGLGLNIFRRSKPEEVTDSQPAAPRPIAPSDVPEKVQDAYGQALFLVERSPRASGALSRYCLQQIIRDFWKIPADEQGTLSVELDRISNLISDETRDSIECVRAFGSIDFHFSQDRDMMVDTTPDEARMLLALVQLLFQEWYVERHKRKNRCEMIRHMAESAKSIQSEDLAPDVEATLPRDLDEPEESKSEEVLKAKRSKTSKSSERRQAAALEPLQSTGN